MGLQQPATDQAGPLDSFLEAEFERLKDPPTGKDERGGIGALIV
jgi:hypothetical protein